MVVIGRPDSIGSRRKGVTGRADIQVRGAKEGGVVQSTEKAGRNVIKMAVKNMIHDAKNADRNVMESEKHVVPYANQV